MIATVLIRTIRASHTCTTIPLAGGGVGGGGRVAHLSDLLTKNMIDAPVVDTTSSSTG